MIAIYAAIKKFNYEVAPTILDTTNEVMTPQGSFKQNMRRKMLIPRRFEVVTVCVKLTTRQAYYHDTWELKRHRGVLHATLYCK